MSPTHGVEVSEGLMHADDLIVQLIIAVWVGQECVTIRDEQVEHIDNLKNKTKIHVTCHLNIVIMLC